MAKKLRLFFLPLCLPVCLLADFSYEQTTKMTGGSMMGMMKLAGAFSKQANEPVRTTVTVKGNRMLHGSKDSAQIIDLDTETITDITFSKKQYTVMTFAEMTQAMERAMQSTKGKKREGTPVSGNPGDTTAEMKVDIKETGARKQIAGYDTKQTIMTMQMDGADQKTGKRGGMVVTNDMWIAPSIPGYDEIREFNKRMAAKIVWTPGGSAMAAGGADMARGMAGISKEVAKLDGIALLMIMKMTPTGDGQPLKDAPVSETRTTPSRQTRPSPDSASISGAIGGKLGGLGGFGRKRKTEAPKEEEKQEVASAPISASSGNASGDASGTLVEMTTELGGFSSATADPAKFKAPSDFDRVESGLQRLQR